MAEIEVLQANAFLRAYKKLRNNQKDAVDQAVTEIIRNPATRVLLLVGTHENFYRNLKH